MLSTSASQDERCAWREQAAEGQGQLRTARSALHALESKVAGLEAELATERAARQAAEQLAEAARQREAQLLARMEAEQAQREQLQGRQGQRVQQQQAPTPWPPQEAPPAAHPLHATSAGAGSGVPDGALLISILQQLQQDVAALKVQQAQQPGPPSAPAPALAATSDGQASPLGVSSYLPAPAMLAAQAAAGGNTPCPWPQQAQPLGGQHEPPPPPQLPSLRQQQQEQGPSAGPGSSPAWWAQEGRLLPGGLIAKQLSGIACAPAILPPHHLPCSCVCAAGPLV
jgi:hypothetical protein